MLVHLQLASPEVFLPFSLKGGPDLLVYNRIYLMIALIVWEQRLEAG